MHLASTETERVGRSGIQWTSKSWHAHFASRRCLRARPAHKSGGRRANRSRARDRMGAPDSRSVLHGQEFTPCCLCGGEDGTVPDASAHAGVSSDATVSGADAAQSDGPTLDSTSSQDAGVDSSDGSPRAMQSCNARSTRRSMLPLWRRRKTRHGIRTAAVVGSLCTAVVQTVCATGCTLAAIYESQCATPLPITRTTCGFLHRERPREALSRRRICSRRVLCSGIGVSTEDDNFIYFGDARGTSRGCRCRDANATARAVCRAFGHDADTRA